LSIEDFRASPGDRILVSGKSGSGKTIFGQAIYGIWERGAGVISLPKGKKIFFASGVSFVPDGTLLEVFLYPNHPSTIDISELEKSMSILQMDHYLQALNTSDKWSQLLSAGERQAVSLLRIMISNPDIVILDDSLSLIEAATRDLFITNVMKRKPDTIIISLEPSEAAADFFNYRFKIDNKKMLSD
jgi:putative ATP-binding cassette transporter